MKIFFSKTFIQIKREDPKIFVKSFTEGDFIYGMIYLKSTFEI